MHNIPDTLYIMIKIPISMTIIKKSNINTNTFLGSLQDYSCRYSELWIELNLNLYHQCVKNIYTFQHCKTFCIEANSSIKLFTILLGGIIIILIEHKTELIYKQFNMKEF